MEKKLNQTMPTPTTLQGTPLARAAAPGGRAESPESPSHMNMTAPVNMSMSMPLPEANWERFEKVEITLGHIILVRLDFERADNTLEGV